MTGHIRRRGTNSFELKYDVGADAAGRRKTRYASFRGTKRDAAIELAKLVAAAAAGDQVDPSRVTVAEFLVRWETWCADQVSPKTHERYGELLRIHVRPHIGALRLQKLRAAHLVDMYVKIGGVLAPRTVGHVHRVVRQALAQAVDWDVLTTNPAARVSPPRVEGEEVEILTAPQVRAILDKARGRPIYFIATLALATGMRRGELLALRWQDVDLERDRVTVARSLEQTAAGLRFKDPKTKHARRTISLPPSAVGDMRAHWREQQELRLALGAGKSPPDGLVFCGPEGQPLRPDFTSQAWRRAARAVDSVATFHSLRHTHASHLIAAGLDILLISRRLGHGSPTITLGVYGHLFPQTDDRAALAIEAAMAATRTE